MDSPTLRFGDGLKKKGCSETDALRLNVRPGGLVLLQLVPDCVWVWVMGGGRRYLSARPRLFVPFRRLPWSSDGSAYSIYRHWMVFESHATTLLITGLLLRD